MPLDIRPAPALPDHDSFEVFAEGLGRYAIEVSLPFGYDGSGKFPIILVTDGNLQFGLAKAILNGPMSRLVERLPPSVVVGVGYPADEGFASYTARRTFDFHEEWDMADPVGRMLHRVFEASRAAEGRDDLELRAGGFERFLAFLREELLPELAAHYPIDLDACHTVIGSSAGAHFVLRALYHPESPFKRYIAISPPLGIGAGAIQRAEADYAATHDDLDADVFVCCGDDEAHNPHYAPFDIAGGVMWAAQSFAQRNWPHARLQWEIMNNEDHTSITPRAIAAGTKSVCRVRPGVHTAEAEALMAKLATSFGLGDAEGA